MKSQGGICMEKELNWAVIGTGVIANEMAQALLKMDKKLYGVANRTQAKAIDFAKKYGVKKVYDEIDEVFDDENVDIIYLATSHNTHYQFMKKALEHGKHLFVEKSITLNSRELDEMMALAKEKNLILAEAMTIWHMPIYKELWKIVQSGELGKMQIMTVNFGSFKEYDMNNRFFNMNLAGGALLDIGVYALSAVRSFMSKQPKIALSMHSKQPKRIMISLEKGYIEVYEFPRGQKATIVDAVTGKQTVIEKGNTENALYYEMCDMEEAVRNQDDSHLNLEYTKDVMDIMSQLRKEWKMQYPGEKW